MQARAHASRDEARHFGLLLTVDYIYSTRLNDGDGIGSIMSNANRACIIRTRRTHADAA